MPLPEVLTVEVKQPHILEGNPGKAGECPVALSIFDQLFPGQNFLDHFIKVYPTLIEIDGWFYDVPCTAGSWITLFDLSPPPISGIPEITFTIQHIATKI